MGRCDACPIPSGRPCRGETRPELNLCQFAASAEPVHRSRVLIWHALEDVPRVRLIGEGVPLPTSEGSSAVVRPYSAEELAEHEALKARVRSCPVRRSHGGCGCDGWCQSPAGRGVPIRDLVEGTTRRLVTLLDCLACPELPGAASDAH